MITDKEIEQVADDEKQKDWNDLRYAEIYRNAFIDGAKWLRSKQVSVEPEVKVNFAEILDDMIKELETEQQTIQNANRDDDWEKYCWDVCDNQLKILYQLQSKISA